MKEPNIDILSLIFLFGAMQNVFFAVLLVGYRSSRTAANGFLAGLLLVCSIALIDGFLSETNYYFKYSHLIGWASLTCFFYGPLVYFYIRTLTSPEEYVFKWEHLLHLIPFGMKTFRLAPLYLAPGEEKISLLINAMGPPAGAGIGLFNADFRPIVLPVHAACYLIASMRCITACASRSTQEGGPAAAARLVWLRSFFIAALVLWCAYSLGRSAFFRFPLFDDPMHAARLLAVAAVLIMGIVGIRRPQVFTRWTPKRPGSIQAGVRATREPIISANSTQSAGDSTEKEKYRKSSLSGEQSASILRELQRIMEADKAYLDPELTLPELSKRLAVSPNHLSQVINGELNKAFFDFINEFRVQEAKKLLRSPEARHLSILGIAMDAGFNSKNAFYLSFKKCTGMTPSQYRDLSTAALSE